MAIATHFLSPNGNRLSDVWISCSHSKLCQFQPKLCHFQCWITLSAFMTSSAEWICAWTVIFGAATPRPLAERSGLQCPIMALPVTPIPNKADVRRKIGVTKNPWFAPRRKLSWVHLHIFFQPSENHMFNAWHLQIFSVAPQGQPASASKHLPTLLGQQSAATEMWCSSLECLETFL